MNPKIVVAVMIAVICVSATHATPRNKRSFSWLPGFLGGGAAVAAEDPAAVEEDGVPVVDNRIQSENVVSGQYPSVDASVIGPIVSNGQIINNQVHYPIWRVQKYQGLNLQPLPIHLVPGGAENAIANQQQITAPIDSTSDRLPPSTMEKIESWLTPELVQMARSFGVTDFSKVPSLEDAMNALGTTTKEDTIEAIKEFAATESGRDLIRQFVAGTQDNEVAASENVETDEVPAENYELDGQNTMQYGQWLLPQNQAQLIAQYGTLGNGPAQSEEQSEAEDPDVETTTPASFFGRISQWTSFLNPFTNRQEIPIPPSEGETKEANEAAVVPLNVSDEEIANQNTVPIPELPQLPPLPSVPGAEQPPPALPNVHIPTRYIPPTLSNGAVPRVGGPYVRIKLPLAGFNPTPQFAIEPQILQYGRNQLQQQVVAIPPHPVFYKAEGVQRPVSVYHRVATTHIKPTFQQQPIVAGEPAIPSQPGAVSRPIEVSQPVDFNKQIYNFPQVQVTPSPAVVAPQTFEQSNVAPAHVQQPISAVQPDQHLQAPQIKAKQFQSIPTLPAYPINVPNFGKLPLDDANYQAFANAPRIVDSYGAPAVPYQYFHDGQPNSFWVSPQANSVNILQEYEVQPSASQIVERKIKANAEAQSQTDEAVEEEEQQQEVEEEEEQQEEEQQQQQQEKQEQEEEQQKGEIVERSNDNAEIASDANQNNEDDQLQQQKAIDVVEAEAEEEKVPENVENELDVKETPSTESTIHRNLRPIKRIIQHPNERKPATSNIQRVVRQDSAATGIVYRANQKTAEWLPYSLRNAVKYNSDE